MIQSRNLNRLREAQARAESPPPETKPGPAFYEGYDRGDYKINRLNGRETGRLETNGALRRGQRVALHGGGIVATPRSRAEATADKKGKTKRGRIKFVYSTREVSQAGTFDTLYVAGWRPGMNQKVMRLKVGTAYFVDAHIDNLGGDRWSVDVCYVRGTVNDDGVPTSGQTYCFAQYQTGRRKWAIQIDAPTVSGAPLQISVRPLGYGFWICSWLPGGTVEQSSGQNSKSKSGCEGSGSSRTWNTRRDTLPQELIVFNGQAWIWETGDRSVGGYSYSESFPGTMQVFPVPYLDGILGWQMGPACGVYPTSIGGNPSRYATPSGNTASAMAEYCRVTGPQTYLRSLVGVDEYCVAPPSKSGGDAWNITQGRITLLPDYRKDWADNGKGGREWYCSYKVDPTVGFAIGEASTGTGANRTRQYTIFAKAGDGPATQARTEAQQQVKDGDRTLGQELKQALPWRLVDLRTKNLFTVISPTATGLELNTDVIRQLQKTYKDNPDALLAAVRSQEKDLPVRKLGRKWAEYILFTLEDKPRTPYPTAKIESRLTTPSLLLMALQEFAMIETYRDFKLVRRHKEKIYAGRRIFPKRGGRTTYTIYDASYAVNPSVSVPVAKTPANPGFSPKSTASELSSSTGGSTTSSSAGGGVASSGGVDFDLVSSIKIKQILGGD